MFDYLIRQFSFDMDESNLPVRAEQIRARMRAFPLMMSMQVLVASLLVALMWDHVSHLVLLCWIAVLLIDFSVECYYEWRYVAATRTVAECLAWRNRMILFVSLASAIWGAGGILMFVPDDLAYQALLSCVFVGIVAGAAITNPVFPPAMYIYVSLMILPLATVNLTVGDSTHDIVAALLIAFWFFVIKAGRDLARIFELSLQRAIENERLVSQLTQEKQRAEQATKLKSGFLAAASHDLRQPMHAITLLIEALKSHVQGTQGEDLHRKVEHSVEVLGGMLDALLDVSRLDAGVIKPDYQWFSMQVLLDRLHEEFYVVADNQGLRLEMSGYDGLVCSDPLLLELVLRNLLSNALRHTQVGKVSLLCEPVAHGLQLTVSDTGIGIAAEYLPHIFEEYYQIGNQHRDRRKGMGLGLAIVRRLEQLLGYQLQVSSSLGEGTSFVLVIPERQFGLDVETPEMLSSPA